MPKHSFFVWALACASLAFGQSGSGSLIVTVSRPISVQPDENVFSVSLVSGLDAGLDDVLTALATSGVTTSNLSSVNSTTIFVTSGQRTQPVTMLQWTFTLPVPISKTKDTVASLAAVRQTIGKNNKGMTLAYASTGLQVSPELLAAQSCPTADLLSDARAQAQKLVSASPELSVGPIIALSDGSAGEVPAQAVSAARVVAGFISPGLVTFPSPNLGQIAAQLARPCTLAVRFNLVRY